MRIRIARDKDGDFYVVKPDEKLEDYFSSGYAPFEVMEVNFNPTLKATYVPPIQGQWKLTSIRGAKRGK